MVGGYPLSENAHLVDGKWHTWFDEALRALDAAFEGLPSLLERFYGRVRTGLSELLLGRVRRVTEDHHNDTIPLEPTIHDLFDRAAMVFVPVGPPSWTWISAEYPLPLTVVNELEGSRDPFQLIRGFMATRSIRAFACSSRPSRTRWLSLAHRSSRMPTASSSPYSTSLLTTLPSIESVAIVRRRRYRLLSAS